ncbi:uncharacterized protein N7483_007360 [Penicillium malachiteum]|uniref:uncharacterized protein n=1 Tax=Penicillium malachiteum TaxID=1324776 RepID=UPI0025499B05|nr:uncharacterized protein N7483_007360 [Penicillium malachiteum]KAJ5726003.1 hypothetical protein N7483_007360 [Penicillium malachiteum]
MDNSSHEGNCLHLPLSANVNAEFSSDKGPRTLRRHYAAEVRYRQRLSQVFEKLLDSIKCKENHLAGTEADCDYHNASAHGKVDRGMIITLAIKRIRYLEMANQVVDAELQDIDEQLYQAQALLGTAQPTE